MTEQELILQAAYNAFLEIEKYSGYTIKVFSMNLGGNRRWVAQNFF